MPFEKYCIVNDAVTTRRISTIIFADKTFKAFSARENLSSFYSSFILNNVCTHCHFKVFISTSAYIFFIWQISLSILFVIFLTDWLTQFVLEIHFVWKLRKKAKKGVWNLIDLEITKFTEIKAMKTDYLEETRVESFWRRRKREKES